MLKVTVLYGHPTDPASFEKYYAETHMPLVAKIPGGARTEKAKVVATPDGSKPAYHRIFEFWFDSQEQMQASLGSPEGQAAVGDLPNFAMGGVTVLISEVE
jgi:uncharacterized protein (TIGR02118 family)